LPPSLSSISRIVSYSCCLPPRYSSWILITFGPPYRRRQAVSLRTTYRVASTEYTLPLCCHSHSKAEPYST
jgi:hypothetical protein